MNTLIKILGIAQDGGIPQIGCNCSNCQKTNNKFFVNMMTLLKKLKLIIYNYLIILSGCWNKIF